MVYLSETHNGKTRMKERNDSGRYSEKYPDDLFIEKVSEMDMPTSPDVARAVGCHRNQAYRRLSELEDRGKLESKIVGRSRVWWIA